MSEIIFERYANKDLLLFIPDADGKDRSREFAILEKEAIEKGAKQLCCLPRSGSMAVNGSLE